MDRGTTIKLAAACIMIFAAVGVMAFSMGGANGANSPSRDYFYDLGAAKLFVAPKSSLPPFKGLEGDEEDAVRAVVIRDSGTANEAANQRIAYLIKFTPKLQATYRAQRENPDSPEAQYSRQFIKSNTMVKLVADQKWVRSDSTKGQKIMTQWRVRDANGDFPVICSPDRD